MKARNGLIVLLALVTVLNLAGCKPAPAPTPTAATTPTLAPPTAAPTVAPPTATPVPEEPVKISIWVMGGETEQSKAYRDEVVSRFMQETGIEVNYLFISWADAYTKITTAIASGEGPDVMQIGTTWVAGMASTGAFTDLTEDVGKIFPPAEVFIPAAWNSSLLGSKVYAIPWFSMAFAMIYREDLWSEAGYPTGPQTWEEMKEGAKKIKEAHPELESVIGLNGQGGSHFAGVFCYQNCGDFISEDGGTATFNDPRNVEATQYWVDLIVEDGTVSVANAEWTYLDLMLRLWKGTIALTFLPNNFPLAGTPEQIEALGDKIGVGPTPRGYQGCRYGFIGGSDLMLFDSSKHKDEAKQLIAFLVRPEIQAFKATLENQAPAVKEAYEIGDLKTGWWPGFLAAASYAYAPPNHPAWGGNLEMMVPELVIDIWTAILGGAYTDATVQELLDQANVEAQGRLDEAGGAPEGYHGTWPQPNP